MPLLKVWIYLFFPQLWINSRSVWNFTLGIVTNMSQKKETLNLKTISFNFWRAIYK